MFSTKPKILHSTMEKVEQFAQFVIEYSSKYNNSNSISYSPENMIGKPEKYPNYGDFHDTYMLRSYGKWWNESEASQPDYMPQDVDPIVSEDYIVLRFQVCVIPTNVIIYETYNPGAVVRIWGRFSGCDWMLMWEGPPQKCEPTSRKFEPKLRAINEAVNELRLEFNQSQLEYYTSLDSILLVGYKPSSSLQLEIVRNLFSPSEPAKEECNEISLVQQTEGGQDYFQHLPHEVLLHIFKNLDLKSLCRCSQVCHRWYQASLDASLYHCLSLKRYWHKINDDTFMYFMKRCKNVRKLDVSWCGYDKRISEEVFLEFLEKCCKNLTHLSVGYCDFINSYSLQGISNFSEVTDLRLRNCKYPSWEFSVLANLKKLVALDLYSSSINDDSLIKILKANPNLKHIIIDLCEAIEYPDRLTEAVSMYNQNLVTWSSWKTTFMTSKGVKNLAKCVKLRELDLGWSLILSDAGDCLEKIANHCKDLRRLIISGWRGVNDQMLIAIIHNCKELTQLDLLGIKNISCNVCELALKTLPKLKLLEVSFCDSIMHDQVNMWRQQFPHVSIQRSCEFVSNDYWN